jgi:hypothetical protein
MASPPLFVHVGDVQGINIVESNPRKEDLGTAALLLTDLETGLIDQIVVEGAPGQGKSMLVQYICQVHRIRWLRKDADLNRLPELHRNAPIRIPFKVDLRDLSSWLSGIDPFSEQTWSDRANEPRTLETFLARLVRYHSGGFSFDVNDLHEVARRAPLLIALDGLDEVADIRSRHDVVIGVTKTIPRLRENCSGLRVVITSRPAAFTNSPGFNIEQFPHLSLGSVPRHQVKQYAQRWMEVRNLSHQEQSEFWSILNEKMEQPHLRDLARNPMQLAILLNLIHTQGTALPDKRTSLYDSYIDFFFSREAAKSAVVRKNIDLLKDIHRYLAWVLHTAAESERRRASGRLSISELQEILRKYLESEQHQTAVLEESFGAMVERVVMIVSRVQGTYEFEVQPLREYFAARHLYVTASYSPPGAERGGTKPDRFDAIARNFYWLNVTRFFCGCFTKGELLDLADRVKELMADPMLGRTRQPFVLAAMLLSDWVFSQTPKAVTEITNALSTREALRRLLPASAHSRSDQVVQVPEACGGTQIVARAFEFLDDPHTRFDLSVQLAALICANTGEKDRDRRWLDATPGEAKLVEKWLRLGYHLGALGRVARSSILAALGEQITSPIPMRLLADAGRFDCLLTDDESASRLIDLLLSSPCRPVMRRVGSPPLYLLPMLLGIEPSDRWRYYNYRFLEARFDSEIDEVGIPELSFGTKLEQQAFDISTSFREAFQSSNLPITSEPFEDALKQCRSNWGERPAIVSMGVTICGMPSRRGRKRLKPVGLFECDKPLCDRLRTAKLRTKNTDWWREQSKLSTTTMDRFLFQFALWNWAPTNMFFDLADELGSMLEAMEETEWRSLAEFVMWASPVWFPLEIRTSSSPKLLPRPLSSKRLALLIGMRDEGQYARAIFLDYLSQTGDGSRAMGMFRQAQALDAALTGTLDWRTALSIIRATDAEGVAHPLAQASAAVARMPETVVQQILSNARDYPLSLWSIAESVVNVSARKAVRPVGKVAKDDRWFPD